MLFYGFRSIHMETPNLQRFFKFARAHCCNYSESGPGKAKHYCCLEPEQAFSECLLLYNKPCRWFIEAVLPMDAALQAQWQPTLDGKKVSGLRRAAARTCSCGKTFRPKSNRQERCPECSERNRKACDRERARKYRRRGRCVTV
jgi:hypothetical protein